MMTFQFFAEVVSGRILNALPAGFLAWVLASVMLRLCGTQKSAIRFTVWMAALTSIACMPLVPRIIGVGAMPDAAFHAKLILPSSLAVIIATAWVSTATLGILRLTIGLWKVHRLRKNSLLIEASALSPELQQMIHQRASGRRISFCISSDVHVPTAIGFFRPMILLPDWLIDELSSADLKTILLHELAHLRRRDDWTNLVQKLLRALFFFHPAVWWIERRLSLEREIACDELVLEQTGNARAYAECLVSLAEKGFLHRGLAMAQAAISRARDLSLRLSRILSAESAIPNRAKKALIASSAACLLILAFAVSGFPEWISFGSVTPASAIAAAVKPDTVLLPLARTANTTEVKQSPGARRRSAQAIAVTQKLVRRHPPSLVRTEFRDHSQPAQQFLLLMRTTRYDEFGDARVSFTVWRVTMPHGRNGVPQAEVIARSL